MTIDDVIDKIEKHEAVIGNFFTDGGGIHLLHEIELSKKELIEMIQAYKGRPAASAWAPKMDANAEP